MDKVPPFAGMAINSVKGPGIVAIEHVGADYLTIPEEWEQAKKTIGLFLDGAKELNLPLPEPPHFFSQGQMFWKGKKVEEVRLRIQNTKGEIYVIGNPPDIVKKELEDGTTRFFLAERDRGRTHLSDIVEGNRIYKFWDLRGNVTEDDLIKARESMREAGYPITSEEVKADERRKIEIAWLFYKLVVPPLPEGLKQKAMLEWYAKRKLIFDESEWLDTKRFIELAEQEGIKRFSKRLLRHYTSLSILPKPNINLKRERIYHKELIERIKNIKKLITKGFVLKALSPLVKILKEANNLKQEHGGGEITLEWVYAIVMKTLCPELPPWAV